MSHQPTAEQKVISELEFAAGHIAEAMQHVRAHGTFGELKALHDSTVELVEQLKKVEADSG